MRVKNITLTKMPKFLVLQFQQNIFYLKDFFLEMCIKKKTPTKLP